MAEGVLTKVVNGVAQNGVVDFCKRHVRSTENCDALLQDALQWCLIPGDTPNITRAAYIAPRDNTEGGWLLEVKGHTLDRQAFTSEFFVVRPDGESAQASVGIYWTGQGLEGSPFGPNNTLIPQNACPGSPPRNR
ncbi:hypothetical protein Pta02_00830 [Planobispora takensis]|uniref:Uncharacterized protein n=1 Tax=Planobispora takensis TaxID=1367882 RepID=A0A8J3WP89_9ACTN|nr:hypothetical protein Pta02_00830 [Planobispora takensis]